MMTDFALDALLAPIDGDAAPCGPDLEYDADYLALQRAAAPKAEKVMGDEVKAAEEPDWNEVADMATALLGRSRDLRIAVPLTAAWVHQAGLSGWAAGLGLVRGLLDNFWDDVHPLLDAEDDNDPTERINAVVPIGDRLGTLAYLQSTPFVQSPRLGSFALRDLRIATGELQPPAPSDDDQAATPPTMTELEACCLDCAEEDLITALAAIDQALEHTQAIDLIFSEHVGTAGPELKPLVADLQELKKFIEPQLAQRSPEAVAGDTEATVEGTDATSATPAATGRINGPQDVMRRLDDICEYYARAEPSSPVPLLLRRAKRLVGMNFEELLQNLAPGGVSELQVIAGNSSDED